MDKTKIYGLEFDETIPQGGEHRILDAARMRNDYVIDGRFQNGGTNDFDSAYPFGAMRLCTVQLHQGARKVTYQGEPGFSLTGESGNVMVEIPKFYSRREKIGTVERWMISGTCHPGFQLEPVFTRGAQELEAVYVGVYNAQCGENGLFSVTGGFPDVCTTADTFRQCFHTAGYDPYDLAMHMCLQKLVMIEFGTRYVKKELGGIGYLRYFNKTHLHARVMGADKNRLKLYADRRASYFAPGHEIGVGHVEHDKNVLHRTVSSVEADPEDGTFVYVCYEGEDMTPYIQVGEDAAFGLPQRNGLADGVIYHTGRGNLHAPVDGSFDALVNSFRYRNIENIWGNVWEHMEGLRIRALRYSYTFDPDQYGGSSEGWRQTSFKASEQRFLIHRAEKLWVSALGYDAAEPLLLLPQQTSAGTPGTYYDGALYTWLDKDYGDNPVDPYHEWRFSVGGGYDHMECVSPFTYRGFMRENAANWLYSSRVCLRKP